MSENKEGENNEEEEEQLKEKREVNKKLAEIAEKVTAEQNVVENKADEMVGGQVV